MTKCSKSGGLLIGNAVYGSCFFCNSSRRPYFKLEALSRFLAFDCCYTQRNDIGQTIFVREPGGFGIED